MEDDLALALLGQRDGPCVFVVGAVDVEDAGLGVDVVLQKDDAVEGEWA